MFNFRQAGDHLYGKKAVHLAVAGDDFDDVLFCSDLLPHEMSWLKYGTKLN